MSGIGRVIVGVSASPGSLPALRYAEGVALREDALLVAVHAWVPPGGDILERRSPSAGLRRVWAEAAGKRLQEALDAAWGCVPEGRAFQAVVIRGELGKALVEVANSPGDLLVVGAGRRGWLARIGHRQVGRYCLAHAQCPVLAVPPAALARAAAHGVHAW